MKHVNFKKRKKAVQNVSKRSAVIPTLQKDPPLSHKGVEMFGTGAKYFGSGARLFSPCN